MRCPTHALVSMGGSRPEIAFYLLPSIYSTHVNRRIGSELSGGRLITSNQFCEEV